MGEYCAPKISFGPGKLSGASRNGPLSSNHLQCWVFDLNALSTNCQELLNTALRFGCQYMTHTHRQYHRALEMCMPLIGSHWSGWLCTKGEKDRFKAFSQVRDWVPEIKCYSARNSLFQAFTQWNASEKVGKNEGIRGREFQRLLRI